MHRAIALALLLLASPVFACAQGFRLFTGRNHPELTWRVAETEHFKIVYPQRLAGIEKQAAPVAEAAYAALSKNLNVTFEEKIRIYLSDTDEIVNGFAIPFGNGYTNTWVHVNEYARFFSGRAKWLRKVLAHELTHIFHYRAVRTDLGFFAYLFGNPLPRFWTEGLAQYETEQWDAQRGDRWLRAAVLDDDLSYQDGQSIWNGRLLYALGASQVRYFAAQYGDSTLARLLHHRKDVLLGLAEVHDFEAALKATTGQSYRQFYDDWRRHVNVYYNTLAGQLHPTDSIDAKTLELPGRYLFDVQFSPATTRVAVLSVPSPLRPVSHLVVMDRSTGETHVVAEGNINVPFDWRPDGEKIAFSRLVRGPHGSLLNDLFIAEADGSGKRRLTYGRRALSPTFSPDGRKLAFIGVAGETANLFLLNLKTGRETQLTHFKGDVQLLSVRWRPDSSGQKLVVARFGSDRRRQILLYDLTSGTLTPVTSGAHDDRRPLWHSDGEALAYTSLRDGVPNTFIYDLKTGTHRRVTHQAVGATATDWLPPDSAHAAGTLVLVSATSKEHDQAFRVSAARTAPPADVNLPDAYTGWTTTRPPHQVPAAIPPDASLVTKRYAYDSWDNLTHISSLALPYYFAPDETGIFGYTAWTTPLGKHTFGGFGGLSVTDLPESFFSAAYLNNQLYPTLALNAYRFPGAARAYGADFLVENVVGGDVSLVWPLDLGTLPYTQTWIGARLRFVGFEPLNPEDFADLPPGIPPPEAGEQFDLRLAFERRTLQPYRFNLVHPLGGHGVRLELTAAAPVLGADARFLRADLAAFTLLPTVGEQRLYLYGRAQAQAGDPFPQDFLGFSRFDNLQVAVPGFLPITLGDNERVRGYRDFAAGNRVLFGSAEYRVPIARSLETQLLGTVSLGATALAAFVDAGGVWRGTDLVTARLGLGLEIKNAVRFADAFTVTHALGIAQPASRLGSTNTYEVYYRIQTALPF